MVAEVLARGITSTLQITKKEKEKRTKAKAKERLRGARWVTCPPNCRTGVELEKVKAKGGAPPPEAAS